MTKDMLMLQVFPDLTAPSHIIPSQQFLLRHQFRTLSCFSESTSPPPYFLTLRLPALSSISLSLSILSLILSTAVTAVDHFH